MLDRLGSLWKPTGRHHEENVESPYYPTPVTGANSHRQNEGWYKRDATSELEVLSDLETR